MKASVYNPDLENEVDEEIVEREMTKEEKTELLLSSEDDILAALMGAADFREETAEINIKRKGKIILRFNVHGLSEAEYNRCRRKNTKYSKNRTAGAKIPEEVDAARYRAMLIYEATTDEDRQKIWQNKKAWQELRVLNGVDLIMATLKAGEQDAVCEEIDKLSGYYDDEEDTIKN